MICFILELMAVSGKDTKWEWVDSTRKMIRKKNIIVSNSKGPIHHRRTALSADSLQLPIEILFMHVKLACNVGQEKSKTPPMSYAVQDLQVHVTRSALP
jgi:hypothetical protein